MSKITGENKQDIEFEVKELNLKDRGKFNNLYHKAELSNPMDWSAFAECCVLGTKFTDDELNDFTDIEIILLAKQCYLVVNKKKLMKST